MLTYFCPECWAVTHEGDSICPNCGATLDDFHNLAYEEKLLAALRHPIAERRMMAAQVLGNINSRRALPEFLILCGDEHADYFFLREVLLAAAKIRHPDRDAVLACAARHPSHLVSKLAGELMVCLESGQEIDDWDKQTG